MGVKDDWIKVASAAGLQDVTTEIENLKKSVSDGKTLVAEAITDKGIITATDAAFATMADNISQISTLATETADATATAAQILTGKRAYVKGSPVVGTMPNNGGPSAAISSGSLKAGYTTGGSITNLLASNVKKGVVIGGIVGSLSTLQIQEGTDSAFSYGEVKNLPFAPKIVIVMLLRSNNKDISDQKICGGTYTGFSDVFNDSTTYYSIYNVIITGNGFKWHASNESVIEYIPITW